MSEETQMKTFEVPDIPDIRTWVEAGSSPAVLSPTIFTTMVIGGMLGIVFNALCSSSPWFAPILGALFTLGACSREARELIRASLFAPYPDPWDRKKFFVFLAFLGFDLLARRSFDTSWFISGITYLALGPVHRLWIMRKSEHDRLVQLIEALPIPKEEKQELQALILNVWLDWKVGMPPAYGVRWLPQ